VTSAGLGFGLLVATWEPEPPRRGRATLEDATDQLVRELRAANPSMRINQGYRPARLGGWNALSAGIISESPFGGTERDWMITAYGPGGRFYYLIGVAPEDDFGVYEPVFQATFGSFRFR
jgi:hypothetical protein